MVLGARKQHKGMPFGRVDVAAYVIRISRRQQNLAPTAIRLEAAAFKHVGLIEIDTNARARFDRQS